MAKLLKFTKSLINFCIHENKAAAVFDVNVFKFQEMKKMNNSGCTQWGGEDEGKIVEGQFLSKVN